MLSSILTDNSSHICIFFHAFCKTVSLQFLQIFVYFEKKQRVLSASVRTRVVLQKSKRRTCVRLFGFGFCYASFLSFDFFITIVTVVATTIITSSAIDTQMTATFQVSSPCALRSTNTMPST